MNAIDSSASLRLRRRAVDRRHIPAVESLEDRLLLAATAAPHDAWLRDRASDISDDRRPEHGAAVDRVAELVVAPPAGETSEPAAPFAGESLQLFYVDLDGARGVRYDGPVSVYGVDVPAFELPPKLVGREAVVVAALVEALEQSFAGRAVTFTREQPAGAAYSTIYVGGDGAAFARYGSYLGLAEKVDAGNRDQTDEALVFSDRIAIEFPRSVASPRIFGETLAAVVAHEAEHLLGAEHAKEADDSHESHDPLARVAWKPFTHVESAKDVRLDLMQDGKLTIAGRDYDVHPKILEAIRDYPSFYNAGSVGPDGFPDLVYGQGIIHPVDTGTWLERVLDMAWAAQADDSFLPHEKLQILAWSYGYVTHAAGDIWAHTMANEFSEDIFPSFTTLFTDARRFANAARHLLLEGYVADATPSTDNNLDRALAPDGDTAADTSPGPRFDAPHRFIYETLIKPFAGDPQLLDERSQPSRGVLLDSFLSLRTQVESAATAAGSRPTESFADLIRSTFDAIQNGQPVPQSQLDRVYRAYLYNWLDSIDAGLQNWSVAGLAITRAAFDPQSPRNRQNLECRNDGGELTDRRADCEDGIGFLTVFLDELDDPNGDGNTADSFINNHLLPMLGFPREFAQFRSVLDGFSNLLDDVLIGPARLAFNPVRELIDRVKDIPKQFVVDQLRTRFGLDIELLDFLTDLGSKMDLQAIPAGGNSIPIFKQTDHAKIDAIMGINGAALSEPLEEESVALLEQAGILFHPNPTGFLNDNVEFDKQRFAPYANTVTLAKLLLLQETRVDDQFEAGQLSKLMSDVLGKPYDFSLLNLNGAHGGNILTATLPKPGELITVERDDGSAKEEPSDLRPWLRSIDSDHSWREDSQTSRTAQFRVHSPGPASTASTWTFTNLPAGTYNLMASWLANLHITPATNATYQIVDGTFGSPGSISRGSVTVNQQTFSDDPGSPGFAGLGTFQITSGRLTVRLSAAADGTVIAGPMKIIPTDPALAERLVTVARDPQTHAVIQQPNTGYAETGAWDDLKYTTGSGNFPLWESELLRPAFRTLFVDWQNGAQNFPDLGDLPSPDPNEKTLTPDGSIGPLVSPFDQPEVPKPPDGQDLVVSGAATINLSGDVVIASIRGNGVGPLDSLTLQVQGTVLLTGTAGGGGLEGITIEATGGITIGDGVTVYSRQVADERDPLGSRSVGRSGRIVFRAPTIAVGAGARVLAHADSGFAAGDVGFDADATTNLAWDLNISGFQANFARSEITIGPGATVTGDTISVTTDASTTRTARVTEDLLPDVVTELRQTIAEFDFFDFSTVAAAVIAKADATITIGAGASLRADRDVTLDAAAVSVADLDMQGKFLGVSFGSSSPTAMVTVEVGASIVAGGQFTAESTSSNTVDVTTLVPGSGEAANVSFSYGRGRAVSNTEIRAGANVQAMNAVVRAANTNSFHNEATATGFNRGAIGVGATVAISSNESAASATVRGNVATTGSLTVDAQSRNTTNETRSFAAVRDPIGTNSLITGLRGFLERVPLDQEIDGSPIVVDRLGPDVTIGGAAAIVGGENRAAALIDDAAVVRSGGDVNVLSFAEDNFQVSATSSAGEAGRASVGGAVAISQEGNQATAFVGPNAIVDAGFRLQVRAEARMPDAVAPFSPILNLIDSDSAAGLARIGEELADGNAAAGALRDALDPIGPYLAGLLNDPAQIGTSFVHAGGTFASRLGTPTPGVAGGVNVLRFANQSAAGIAGGAQVNQGFDNLPVEQDVTVEAIGSIESVNLAGQNSVFGFGGTSRAAIGGYFDGVFYNNRAAATIEDRAAVSAGHDVLVHSQTQNDLLTAVQAGAAGEEISIDGAIAFVNIVNESRANIEDRARVVAGHDLNVLADNDTDVLTAAGGLATGATTGVGVSAALANIRNTTHAFIGDVEPMGELGTGGVTGSVAAGNDLTIAATSDHDVWAVAVSGAESGEPLVFGRPISIAALQFGVGVSGDAAFNFIRDDVQAYIRNVADVTVAGDLEIRAGDQIRETAGAGTVAFANHTGIGGSFASNGFDRTTRAFTEDAQLDAATIGVTATATDRVLTVSDGGGGSNLKTSVAGSANLNRLTGTTDATLGDRTEARTGGALQVRATTATDVLSEAGATSAAVFGSFAVGAAVDLGFLNLTTNASAGGDQTNIDAGDDITVNSDQHETIRSIPAASAAANGVGEATRLYVNQGGSNLFGPDHEDITNDELATTAVALEDLDGDGDLDLVTGNFGQFNHVFENKLVGGFDSGKRIGTNPFDAGKENSPAAQQIINSQLPDATTAIDLADVDSDGDLDLVAGNFGQLSRLYLNDGTGEFFPGIDVGSLKLPVTVERPATTGNENLDDLIADIQQAVIAALVAAGQPSDSITVRSQHNDVTGEDDVFFAAGSRQLPATAAEQAVADARAASGVRLAETLSFTIKVLDTDLVRSVALGDLNGDGRPDLVVGNLNAPSRVYYNLDGRRFTVGFDLSPQSDLTMSVALADLDLDGDDDIITGNVGFDVAALVEQGLVRAGDFLNSTLIRIEDLVTQTAVRLVDLVRERLLTQLDFDSLADIPITDLVTQNLTRLEDLVRAGLLVLGNFSNISLKDVDLIASGIVTAAELAAAGLVDAAGNVSSNALVNSGLVFLEELIRENFVGLANLNISDLNLGDLLGSGEVDLAALVESGLATVADLLRDKLSLDGLLQSGLVKLQELADSGLLGAVNLNFGSVDLASLADRLSGGAANKFYLNDGMGHFDSGHELADDLHATRSIVAADVNGDGAPDIVAGNFGTPNRLYLNDGNGNFDAGTDITSDRNRTQAVVLADIDGDQDLDLVTANLEQPTQIYLNNGLGNFTRGPAVSSDTPFSTSLAVGDVDGDGRADVIVGTAKPQVVAGSITSINLAPSVTAAVPAGATITTPLSLFVTAHDTTDVVVVTGAEADGNLNSVGLSVANTNIERSVQAFIEGSTVTARGLNAPTGGSRGPRTDPGVIVTATTDEDIVALATGRSEADELAVQAGAVFNNLTSSTAAFVGPDATVNFGATGLSSNQSVTINAEHTSDILGAAGSAGDATRTGVGAAADVAVIDRDVLAYIGPGARVHAERHVNVDADSNDHLASFAIGAATTGFLSGDLAVAGSLALYALETETRAFVDAAEVNATGNVIVAAHSVGSFLPVAGAAADAGLAGVALGVSATAVFTVDVTEARIMPGADVRSRGLAGGSPVPTSQRDSNGSLIFASVPGVLVTAISTETVLANVLGGEGGGKIQAAGSLAFVALNETTRAGTDEGASVNQFAPGVTTSATQSVHVFAIDDTVVVDQPGTNLSARRLGVGGGVDFVALTKTTEAFVGGVVDANQNVDVGALSHELLVGVANGSVVNLATGLAAAAATHALEVATRAYIAERAQVRSKGNVRVAARDESEVQLDAGITGLSGLGSAGASVAAALVNKTTEAFIAADAVVSAAGGGEAIDAPTGAFDIQIVPNRPPRGPINITPILVTLFGPLAGLLGPVYVNVQLDGLRDVIEDLYALAVTPTDLPSLDPDLTGDRVATPVTRPVRGVSVSALTQERFDTHASGRAAALAGAAEFSGAMVVTANRTSAYIDGSVTANASDPAQNNTLDVLVGAGSDLFHRGTAGAVLGSGLTSVGSSGIATLTDNLTESFVGPTGTVATTGDVEIAAHATEDTLLLAVGLGASLSSIVGSLPLVSIQSASHAFVAPGGHVTAIGNIDIIARDDTDIDLIAGAESIGGLAIGASLAMTLIDKDTRAFVGSGAIVDALGQGAGVGRVTLASGLRIDAASSENVYAVATSGAGGLGPAFAGTLGIVVVDSDTTAFIDDDALVNTNSAGAAASQSVIVFAANDSHVFDTVVNLTGGAGNLSAAVDVGIIRNDTAAFIGDGAVVHAAQDILVTATSSIEADSVASALGLRFPGINANLSFYSIHGQFGDSLLDNLLINLTELLDRFEDVPDFIDGQASSLTAAAGTGITGILKTYLGTVNGVDDIADAIAVAAPQSPVEDAFSSNKTGAGATASVRGATLVAGRDVMVTATESLDTALDTSYAFLSILSDNRLPDLPVDMGFLNAVGKASALIEQDANVSARDVIVDSGVTANEFVSSTLSITDVSSVVRSRVDNADVAASGDVVVDATSHADTIFSAMIPGTNAIKVKFGVNHMADDVEARILRNSHVTAGGDVTVSAMDDSTIAVTAISDTFGSSGLFGALPIIAGSVVINDLENHVTAAIDASDVTAAGDVNVIAVSDPELLTTAFGISVVTPIKSIRGRASEDQISIAGSVVINTLENVVAARIESNAHVTAGQDLTLRAEDLGTVVAKAGAGGAFSTRGTGVSFSKVNMANHVTVSVDNSTAAATAGSVSLIGLTSPNVRSFAFGLQEAESFAGGGSLPFNSTENRVDALVTGGAVVTSPRNVAVTAADVAEIVSIAGGAGVTPTGAASFGAAIARNRVMNSARAAVDDATITSESATISADSRPKISGLAVGAGFAESFDFAGSVSLNTIENQATAEVTDGANVTTASLLAVRATDDAILRVLAGEVALSNTVSVGAAVAKNTVASTMRASVEDATVNAGRLEVTARATAGTLPAGQPPAGSPPNPTARLEALAIGGTGAGTVAIAASLSLNKLDNLIEASIADQSSVAAPLVALTARDESTIRTLAGGVAGAGSVAIGVGMANNEINNEVRASILDSQVQSSGQVTVVAQEQATIEVLAAGIGGAGQVAVTGALSRNIIANAVESRIARSVVSAAAGIGVAAHDTATIRAFAGQVSGAGAAAVGAAASYNKISDTVKAFADGATLTAASGSVNFLANGESVIESLTAGGSGGTFAFAGSVGVNLLESTVEAFSNGSTIDSGRNVTVVADADNAVKNWAGTISGGAVGIGGTSVVTKVANTTKARVSNSTIAARGDGNTTGVPMWNGDTGAESTEQVRGLAVIATAGEDVDVRAVTAAGGGVGVAGNVSVTTIADDTESFIEGSAINTAANFGESVIVRAHQDSDVSVIGGALGIGGVGVGAAVDTTFVRNATRAFVREVGATDVTIHARDFEVGAFTREHVSSILLGVAVGGVAASGVVSVVILESNNDAFVQDADVFAHGAIEILADNIAEIDTQAGAGAAGFAGSAGGSVVVNFIRNTTEAQAVGAHTNATGATQIKADTDESITTTVGTGAVGVGISLAGSVSVNTIETTTEAAAVSSAARDSLINQDAAFQPGGAFNPDATQTVRIEANDAATINGKGGSISAALGSGVGAAIDVAAIRNRTVAAVGTESRIFARGNIDIRAAADRDVESLTVALGAGLLALSGSISVVSLGSPIAADGAGEFNSDLRTQVGDDIRLRAPALESSPDCPSNELPRPRQNNECLSADATGAVNDLPDPSISSTLNTTLDTSLRITSARVQDATSQSLRAELRSGGNISITSNHTYDVEIETGQTAVGGAGIGAAIGIVSMDNATSAFAGNFSLLNAAGGVLITANDVQEDNANPRGDGDDATHVTATAGNAGVIAVGGAIARADVDLAVDAHLGRNAEIRNATVATIEATQTTNLVVNGVGRSGGAVAAGAVVTKAEVNGTVKALADDNARIGGSATESVGTLNVTADGDNQLNATSTAGAAGVLSGQLNKADALVQSLTIEAALDSNADAIVANDINVRADSSGDANATARGRSVGVGTLGLSKANAKLDPTVRARADADTLQAGDAISVEAVHSGSPVNALAESSGGGGISGNGAESDAAANASVTASVGSQSNLAAIGDVSIRSTAINNAQATGNGNSVALIGIGGVEADADANGSSAARMNGDVTAANLTIEATSTHLSSAVTTASGGGLISATSADADADVDSETEATIGNGANVMVTGTLNMIASSTTDADATATGDDDDQLDRDLFEADGFDRQAVGFGNSRANVNVTPTVECSVGANSTIVAGDAVAVTAFHLLPTGETATALAKSSDGSLIGSASGGFADATSSPNVQAFVDHGSDVTAGSVLIRAKSDSDAESRVENHSGGLFVSVGVGKATVTMNPVTTATVGDNSTFHATEDFTLNADSELDANAFADAAGKAIVPRARADAKTDLNHSTKAEVGPGAQIDAGDRLSVLATSDVDGEANVDADSLGFGEGAVANDDRGSGSSLGDPPRGVLIGETGTAETRGNVLAGAVLQAREVIISATSDRLSGEADSDAHSAGGGSDAAARVLVDDDVVVFIAGQTQISGHDQVEIIAEYKNVRTSADASARGASVDRDAIAETDVDLSARVQAADTAHIETRELLVRVPAEINQYEKLADKGPGNIGDELRLGNLAANRRIDWNADVVLLNDANPILEIGPAGSVLTSQNVTFTNTATQITVGNIANSARGAATFEAQPVNGFGNASRSVISGTLGSFNFQDSFEFVRIINQSPKPLIVGGIDVTNDSSTSAAAPADIVIDVERVDGVTVGGVQTTGPFRFDVLHSFAPTLVEIRSENAAATADVTLSGVIDNPIAETRISVAGGDIVAGNAGHVVRSNVLDLDAPAGSIGLSATSRINVELVRSAGRPGNLSADAGQDVHLSLMGRVREIANPNLTIPIERVAAGDDVDLLLQGLVRETTFPGLGFTVKVSEPQQSLSTNVSNHFRPGVGGPPFVLDLGLFGTNPQAFSGPYTFTQLEAGDSLTVRGIGTTPIEITGTPHVLGAGDITLTNLTGNNLAVLGGSGINSITLNQWSGAATVDGAAGADRLTLTQFAGTVTTVDTLTLSSPLSVAASTTPAVINGNLNLDAEVTLDVANGAAVEDLVIAALLSGSGGILKQGSGAATLTANNTYAGVTRVNAGDLAINGVQPSSQILLGGGILRGTGTTGRINNAAGAGAPASNGTLNPGMQQPAQLTTNGDLSLTLGNQLAIDFADSAGRIATDRVAVIGRVTLGGTLQLNLPPGLTVPANSTITLIDNDGTDAVTSTFVGLREKARVQVGASSFTISYRGGTGNDVVLKSGKTRRSNRPPMFPDRQVTSPVREGDLVVLTGTIVEPDPGDTFILEVTWGDGTPKETFVFRSNGKPQLSLPSPRQVRLTHRYADNPQNPLGEYLVELLWRDQHGAFNTATVPVVVTNAAPVVDAGSNVRLQPGRALERTGTVLDPGVDALQASVDYGDGSGPQPLALDAAGEFQLQHIYERSGVYRVTVTVQDDDGGTNSDDFTVHVLGSVKGRHAARRVETPQAGQSLEFPPVCTADNAQCLDASVNSAALIDRLLDADELGRAMS